MIRVAIYDDDDLFRDILKLLINDSDEFEVVGSYSRTVSILKNLKRDRSDVVLMDINMPQMNGINALRLLKGSFPDVNVLMLTSMEDKCTVLEAMRWGANGYILKGIGQEKLLNCIREVFFGGAPMSPDIASLVLKTFSQMYLSDYKSFNLTDREMDVLKLIVKGYSYKMIACELFISIDTVRFHIKKVYEKLSVNSKSQAIIKAYEHNLFL